MFSKCNSPFLVIVFLVCFSAVLSGCQATQNSHSHHDQVKPEYVFTPTQNLQEQIEETLSHAKLHKKLGLIVLGAQWCHDSRGLAANFSKPEMQKILEQRFVTLFIDVGYLQDRREITRQFGYPAYFATPTVLIVDPESNQLINQSTLNIWQAADSVPFDTYLEHFSSIAAADNTPLNQQHPARAEIEHFTQRQVERLHRGYAVLGPMLKADVEGRASDRDELNRLWKEVREFRITLQKDIHQLRESMTHISDHPVSLPEYPTKSWEQ